MPKSVSLVVVLMVIWWSTPLHAATFQLCTSTEEPNCVLSGDTIRYQGASVRIEDIDAPNIEGYKCVTEQMLGVRAGLRLAELLSAGPFDLIQVGNRTVDPIGRQLRSLHRNGQSIGMQLVNEGLAVRWEGHRHNWCS